jgi:uncharacterized protein YjiS (DUF1127 family)
MAAITSLAIYGATPLGRALAALTARATSRLKRMAGAVKNRRDAARLAALDERMLADIGLTRADLRDAFAEPLWRDPTNVLAQRASERRLGRRKAVANCVNAMAFASPFGNPPPVLCRPSSNRPAHIAM